MKAHPVDKRIERLYYKTCSGIQISIWDMSKIMDVGRSALIDNDLTDEQLGTIIRNYVETIRRN
jgi:hypothetical protein